MSTITIQDLNLEQPFTVLRADFAPSALVTEHPVEQGVESTDQIKVRPLRILVEAIVSDTGTPGRPQPGVAQAVRWLTLAQGRFLDIVIDNEGEFRTYALEAAQHARTVIRGRVFRLRLKQVRIATALTSQIPEARTTAPTMAAEEDVGQQGPGRTILRNLAIGAGLQNP